MSARPGFEGQTKTRLGNPEVRKIVESVIADQAGGALRTSTRPTLTSLLLLLLLLLLLRATA